MKTRNREINIFSMSALDLFASAMGAFILIAFVLFPYFPNTGDSQERVADVRAQLERVQRELQATQGQLGACESQNRRIQESLNSCEEQLRASPTQAALGACENRNQQLEAQLETCEAQAKKKFLLVIMSWGKTDDIDLHVTDPAGREFYYQQRSFSGSQARLEEDNTRGPGNEIWLHPVAEAGTYQVHYNYYNYATRTGGNVSVRGSVLTPEGRTSLPTKTLRRKGEKILVATITVDTEGNMSVSRR